MAEPQPPREGLEALERELLGGERKYTRAEVAARAGVDLDTARRLWRALGFADLDDGNVAFTDRDVEALVAVQSLVEMGIVDEQTQLGVTRAMGQTLSRLADWQVATITDVIGDQSELTAAEATDAARELVPVIERLMGYVWRRHLAATAGRALAGGHADSVTRSMAVGFADLVGFTALTRSVEEDELVTLVDRFETVASDIVTERGGRIVKTLGDEVLFAVEEPAVAADIAVSLAAAVAEAPGLPDVRVGVAYGTVLARLGDVYGEPVNVASRLTSIARSGSVLVDRELASALEGDDRWRLRRVPPRPVRGYAMLQGFRLRRAEESS